MPLLEGKTRRKTNTNFITFYSFIKTFHTNLETTLDQPLSNKTAAKL